MSTRRSRRSNPWEDDGRNVRARFHTAPAQQDQEQQQQFNIVTSYQKICLMWSFSWIIETGNNWWNCPTCGAQWRMMRGFEQMGTSEDDPDDRIPIEIATHRGGQTKPLEDQHEATCSICKVQWYHAD